MSTIESQFHVFIGTKAQYIKTAPLLRLMQKRGVSYNLIDSGQHAAFSPKLRKELGLKEPDMCLKSKGNIKTIKEVLLWFVRYMLFSLFNQSLIRKDIFGSRDGICIIHGDTPSTLLALILAKRAGLRVAHIEAGLRSFNVLRPFPEEIIRIICMHCSDYLFAPSDWAYQNIVRMHVKGKTFNVHQNTNVEALYYSLIQAPKTHPPNIKYCLMTIHRVETILRKRRLRFIVELAERIAQRTVVFFVLHDPTRKKLQEFGWLERITTNSNIKVLGLIAHANFLSLLSGAEFVVTDGGSIQEESFYIDVPCLSMRTETERQEGIGANVQLSNFDQTTITRFLSGYTQLKRGKRVDNCQPSAKIFDILLREIEHI